MVAQSLMDKSFGVNFSVRVNWMEVLLPMSESHMCHICEGVLVKKEMQSDQCFYFNANFSLKWSIMVQYGQKTTFLEKEFSGAFVLICYVRDVSK